VIHIHVIRILFACRRIEKGAGGEGIAEDLVPGYPDRISLIVSRFVNILNEGGHHIVYGQMIPRVICGFLVNEVTIKAVFPAQQGELSGELHTALRPGEGIQYPRLHLLVVFVEKNGPHDRHAILMRGPDPSGGGNLYPSDFPIAPECNKSLGMVPVGIIPGPLIVIAVRRNARLIGADGHEHRVCIGGK